MPNKYEMIDKTISNLYKIADKSYTNYSDLLEEFNILDLNDIQKLSPANIEQLFKKTNNILKGKASMGKKTYGGKEFDVELEKLLFRQAVKLAAEEEPPKEEPPKEEAPKEEAPKEEETEQVEGKKIEDIVKDQQIALMDKFNAVKSFKPGRSEAINFRNAISELIKVSEDTVKIINDYYAKELGGTEE